MIGRAARRVPWTPPSTTCSATRASTTSRLGTSSSATASGPAASRSTRSARWVRSSSRPTRSATRRISRSAAQSADEILQEARTSQMYFTVAEVVSYCSMAFTLEPGDVIASGTPAGVGAFRNAATVPCGRRSRPGRDRADRRSRERVPRRGDRRNGSVSGMPDYARRAVPRHRGAGLHRRLDGESPSSAKGFRSSRSTLVATHDASR